MRYDIRPDVQKNGLAYEKKEMTQHDRPRRLVEVQVVDAEKSGSDR